MDPITILGTTSAIAKIINVITGAINSLRELRYRWKDTDMTIFNLILQLTSLKAALNKISEWLSSDLEDTPQHHQLVIDLEDSVSCCRMLVKSMDDQISKLDWNNANALDLRSKSKVVFERKTYEDFQKYIDRQTSALNLLLTACNCKSISEQKALLEKSVSREVFDKAKDDSSSMFILLDTTSFVGEGTQSIENSSKISKIFPSLDEELAGTQVYRRFIRSLFISSLRHGKVTETESKKSLLRHTNSKSEKEDQASRSKNIDSELLVDRWRMMRECHVLLLGDIESGKDLIWTQLKLLLPENRTKEALLSYKNQIISIVFDGINALLTQLENLDLNMVEESCRLRAKTFYQQSSPSYHVDSELRQAFESFWSLFSHVLSRPTDSPSNTEPALVYFLNNLNRIAKPEYLPTEQDILRLPPRQHIGIQEIKMPWRKLTINILTPGLMVGETKKWIHQAEKITTLAFVVDLCSYDQVGLVGDRISRLDETVTVFGSIVGSRWLKRRSVILFLNNVDHFKIKIQKSPLSQRFPKYDGGDNVDKAKEFILGLFKSANVEGLVLYVLFINPIDQRVFPFICDALQDTILKEALSTLRLK